MMMHNAKNSVGLLLYMRTIWLLLFVHVACPVLADYTCTTNGYTFCYTLNDAGQATITENKEGKTFSGEELVIPAKIDGYEVAGIGDRAFYDMTNSYYSTKRGKVFIENGPTEIGSWAFLTDKSGWECVCVPPSVNSTSGSYNFYGIDRLYLTIDSLKLDLGGYIAFLLAPNLCHIIATASAPNLQDDMRNLHQAYYKCRRSDYSAWCEKGGADRFRGYVADNYEYGEKAVVSFDDNGIVATATYRQGSPYETLPKLSRPGYVFDGWHTEPYPEAGYPNGIHVSELDAVASPVETLYARWTETTQQSPANPISENVTAKPRYPWNGKVDISFEVLGENIVTNAELVAHWSLDGDTSDATGNGHDLQNGLGSPVPAEDRRGAANKAYAFDGKSYLNMKDADPFIVMTNFTISLWFKTPVTMSEHGTSRTNWNPGNDVLHAGFADYLCVGVGLRVGTDGVAVVEHGGVYRPTVLEHKCDLGNTWHHVAVTVADNGGEMLYLDGQYIGTAEINPKCLTRYHGYGTKAAYFDNGANGGIGGGQWGYYTGSVDDVRVYNRALSAGEIAELYQNDMYVYFSPVAISFSAKDLAGGTNIAMRTVYAPGGSVTNSTFNLAPGKYNFIWDADADLPDGFVGEQISVKVTAE